MDKKQLDEIMSSMKATLGEEQTATISDQFGLLVTANQKALDSYSELEKEKTDLEKRNRDLVAANSSLLQQVGSISKPEEPEEPEEEKPYDFNSLFDGKGHFKKGI